MPAKPEPKRPDAPLSLRLGKDRETQFLAFRKAFDLPQSTAIHRLMDIGLREFGFAPEPEEAPQVCAPSSRWRV